MEVVQIVLPTVVKVKPQEHTSERTWERIVDSFVPPYLDKSAEMVHIILRERIQRTVKQIVDVLVSHDIEESVEVVRFSS